MSSEYFKIVRNNWESIRKYDVGNSQDMPIASMKSNPIALLCQLLANYTPDHD